MSDFETIKWRKTCERCQVKFEDSMVGFMGNFPIRVREFKTSFGVCPACKEKEAELRDNKIAATWFYWTEDTIKQHFIDNPPYKGQELIVRDTSNGFLTYAIVTVDDPCRGPQKNIRISSYSNGYSGPTFYRSGKNHRAPKGQVHLLPYNETIGELIKNNGGKPVSYIFGEGLDIIDKLLTSGNRF